MSALPAGRVHVHSGHWLRGVCLVGLLLITGCVNNPDYVALENLPVNEPAERAERPESSAAREPSPQNQSTPPEQAPARSGSAPEQEDLPAVYTVERGDTLYSIAFRYSRDFRDLARANGIEPPYLIVPGQKIDTQARVSDTASDTTRSAPEERRTTGATTPPADTGPPANSSGGDSAEEPTRAPGDWLWPVRGDILRSFSDGPSGSKGIDIGASAGTSIQASADGTVVYAGDGLRGYGNLIILEHPGRMVSAYAFTDQIAVSEQDRVSQGDVIARVGARGDTALLHFEIRSEGKPVNPLNYLPE